MRILFALVAVVIVLFALDKLPFAAKRQPVSPVAVQAPATAEPSRTAAKVPEVPRVTYVSTRECARGFFGGTNCKEVTTVKP